MSFVENLNFNKDGFSLQIPHLQLLDKGVHVIWGPSGSGKSTLMKALAGIEYCHGMRWIFNGSDLNLLRPKDRNLGVVFQTLDLFPHMTAEENILFACEAKKLDIKEEMQKMSLIFEKLQMSYFLKKSITVLSGGEKQRVAIARALVGSPCCLLLDEPFSSLDEDLRAEGRTIVKELIDQLAIPIILVTHDVKDIEILSQKVTQIRDGRIIE